MPASTLAASITPSVCTVSRRARARAREPHRGHCAVRIAKGDDQGRERLVRSCARPPFAQGRIELLPDRRVAYLLNVPRRGRTHRVMTPMEWMARLAVLIPPPRIPLGRS